MKGYKIAVGIDRENGPFPVMVELEIPDDAIVITPRDDVEVEVYNNVGSRIGVDKEFYSIKKYRTNKVKVINIIPENKFEVKEWNGKAYPLYGLGNFPDYYDEEDVYFIGKEMKTYLSRDVMLSCGPGFHFFKSGNDALMFYINDKCHWAANIISNLQKTWDRLIYRSYLPTYETLVELSK